MIECCLGCFEIRGGIGAADRDIETPNIKACICSVTVGANRREIFIIWVYAALRRQRAD